MKLLIIGASRGIGLAALKAAIRHGHHVRAFARGAEGLAVDEALVERWPGDATDPEALAPALQGVDAVLMTLGVEASLERALKPVDVFSRATEALLPLMQAHAPRRLIAVTGFGAGDSRSRISFVESLPFRAFLGQAYADKDIQERLIKESGLDWTIVRPTILTASPATGRFEVLTTPEAWRNGLIARADVAEFLISAAAEGTYLHETPVLAY